MTQAVPLTIIAIITAQTGGELELRTAQQQLVRDTLQEPGCLRYELNQSLDDGRVLVFVESWATEAAWHDHMQGAAIQRFRASDASKLIAERVIHRLTPVS